MVELLELPADHLSKILLNLPIKTICQFRCVCKTLRDVTSYCSKPSDQHLIIQFNRFLDYVHFIEHAQLDTINHHEEEKTKKKKKELSVSPIFEIPKWKNIDEHYYPRYHPYRIHPDHKDSVNNRFILVNACNGLILLATKTAEMCSLVCNPITKEHVRVPEVDEKNEASGSWTRSLWLGFCRNSGKYKVLRFGLSDGNPFRAYIHVVGSSTWREIESYSLNLIHWDCSYAFLNGVGYWLYITDSHDPRIANNLILSFDFEREVFGRIDTPPDFKSEYSITNIGIVGDSLCLIDNNDESLDIWMMNGTPGQWIKQFGSVHAKASKPMTGLRPLQLLNSWEILMVSEEGTLSCFDMKKNSFRLITFSFHTTSKSSVVNFVPSFVSLKDALMGY